MTDTNVDIDRFGSRRSTVYGQRGVVSTSQPLAAQAGLRTLRDGGNAFDAAVATAAALNVVEPTSTGLGGDVFALYRTADDESARCGAVAVRRQTRSPTRSGRPSPPTGRRATTGRAEPRSAPATPAASTPRT
jgi:gamma-glutamyltranspeptidase